MKILGKFKAQFFFLLALAVVMSSCRPRLEFTEANRTHLATQKIDINRVQFYTDKELILRRDIPNSVTEVARGEITERNGRKTVEIRIPRGTPGVVEAIDEGIIVVAFEEDCPECLLRFYRNRYDCYQVDADNWIEKQGQISYDGFTFYLTPPYNDAILMVKKKELNRDRTNSHIVKGKRLNSRRKKRRRSRRTYEDSDEFDEYKGNPNWDGEDEWETETEEENWEDDGNGSGSPQK